MDKPNVIYFCIRVLLSHNKEWMLIYATIQMDLKDNMLSEGS